MGNGTSSKGYSKFDNRVIHNRIIDDKDDIYLVTITPIDSNIYSNQAIQIGRGYLSHIWRLENFTENINSLVYEFENEYKLSLTKRGNDIILKFGYRDSSSSLQTIKKMDELTRRNFEPFENNNNITLEFNKIYGFIRIEDCIKND
jgi:hypothetical protein